MKKNTLDPIKTVQKNLYREKHDEYEKIIDQYEDSSDSKKVDILFEAIGWMQMYNGRSINDCIVLSMGGTIDTINDHILKEG